ncbi:hypothetical protein [Streptomyces collinus]|uniref:hypothetical protein n=1 Tax=Streptomyces collinus TaxID=42684 RepID=UPI0033C32CF9
MGECCGDGGGEGEDDGDAHAGCGVRGAVDAGEGARECRGQKSELGRVGPCQLQAGIPAVHDEAELPSWARTLLRLPRLPLGEDVTVRPADHLLTGTIRWAISPPRHGR